jgi:1-acyl-sn-glycerol-3-phosphate acyltransferase
MERMLTHPIFAVSVGLFGLFAFFVAGLVFLRRTTKHLIEDLGLARHILITWFVVPFFWAYFLLLQKTGKLIIIVNSPIPWSETKRVFVGNHAMPKLQDTFLIPVIIFFLNVANIANPIRFFPASVADKKNFFDSRFFQRFAGKYFLVSVDRKTIEAGDGKMYAGQVIKECEKRFEMYSGSLITNIEGGRTQSAENLIISRGGSELGEPTRGFALLALKTNVPIIPYWCREINISYRRFSPQAIIWRLLGKIFRKQLQRIGFYESRPEASPRTILWGLLELGLNPGVRTYIDINHPDGFVRPVVGEENSRQLTERFVKVLLDLGDRQLGRIEEGRKKR